MSSIDTFWLANALGEHRAIAERHSTEVECLKNYQIQNFLLLAFCDLFYLRYENSLSVVLSG